MLLRSIVLTLAFLTSYLGLAQRAVPPSDALSISGKVKNPTTFTLDVLDTFPKTIIKDQIIYNHNGEIKDSITGMRGIALKSLLSTIKYENSKPRFLNEFYFVFEATDGYKVVFSWNEIYNTETGNQFFIITEINGKKGKHLENRIQFIATADLKSGRRYIKGLKRIEVKKVE